MNAQTRLRTAPRVVARRIGGELVVVTMPGLETRVLNDVGARVVELARATTAGEIAAVIAREAGAPVDVVLRDVLAFAEQLVAERVLVADD